MILLPGKGHATLRRAARASPGKQRDRPPHVSIRDGVAPARATILYIEDDPPSRHLLEVLFEQRPDLCLLTATDGRQGLELARRERPDLILLDFHLQDMDGEAVLRALRAIPELRRTPVVLFTAEQYSRLPEHLRAAGAQAYVMKPVDVTELFPVLEATLSATREGRD